LINYLVLPSNLCWGCSLLTLGELACGKYEQGRSQIAPTDWGRQEKQDSRNYSGLDSPHD